MGCLFRRSIIVLKDAAAIALYGPKASNGVILLTTKKGKAGSTVINLWRQMDISKSLKWEIELLNQQEYLYLLVKAYINYNPTSYSDSAAVRARFPFPVGMRGPIYLGLECIK